MKQQRYLNLSELFVKTRLQYFRDDESVVELLGLN